MAPDPVGAYVIRTVGKGAIKLAFALALLGGAWAAGRANGSAHPEFQIVLTTFGPSVRGVNLTCEKGCKWNVVSAGCDVRTCSFTLNDREGLRRSQ